MAREIGSLTFDIFQGTIQGPGMGATVRERKGEDGSEIRLDGQRERPSRIRTTISAVDAADAANIQDSYYEAKSTIVEVVDAGGITHPEVFIADVTVRIAGAVNPTSDPAHTRIVHANWQLRKLDVAD